jgi:hypothetical protein
MQCRIRFCSFVVSAERRESRQTHMSATTEIARTRPAEPASNPGKTTAWTARVRRILRSFGPYAAIEILLPGGSLMALALWLYRWHRRRLDHQGDEPTTRTTAIAVA